MLEFRNLSLSLPRRGPVLQGITTAIEPGRLTAIIGTNGAGASTWLRHLADRLPNGARSCGSSTWCGRELPPANRHGPLLVADWALPPLTVGAWLRGWTHRVAEVATGHGLEAFLQMRIHDLPLDLRARLHLVTLRHAPGAALVLADPLTTAAALPDRRAIAQELRRRAHDGAVVLWAEHDLDLVWEHTDHVIELSDGGITQEGDVAAWVPLSVPEPTLMTLARAHDLERAVCRNADDTHQALRAAGPRSHRLLPATVPPLGDTIHVPDHGLGEDVELTLGSRECLGVVDVDGRAEPIARRLVNALEGGTLLTSHLPSDSSARSVTRSWEHRHALLPGSVLDLTPGIRGDDLLRNHGSGDAAGLRAALAMAPRHPLWFPHPQAGLDTQASRDLAAALAAGCPGPRIVTSRDPEFLVRACHRILVVKDGAVIGLGTARAVAPLLPDRPLVARATGLPHHTRLTELLEVEP